MSRRRITWISPIGTAHLVALAWASIVIALVLIYIPVMVVLLLWGHSAVDDMFPELLIVGILLPIAYYMLGWIMGYVTARMFNLFSRFTKGVEVDVVECDQSA